MASSFTFILGSEAQFRSGINQGGPGEQRHTVRRIAEEKVPRGFGQPYFPFRLAEKLHPRTCVSDTGARLTSCARPLEPLPIGATVDFDPGLPVSQAGHACAQGQS